MYMHLLEEVLACFTSGGDDVVRARRFAGFEKRILETTLLFDLITSRIG